MPSISPPRLSDKQQQPPPASQHPPFGPVSASTKTKTQNLWSSFSPFPLFCVCFLCFDSRASLFFFVSDPRPTTTCLILFFSFNKTQLKKKCGLCVRVLLLLLSMLLVFVSRRRAARAPLLVGRRRCWLLLLFCRRRMLPANPVFLLFRLFFFCCFLSFLPRRNH